jgi:hypothetical protein
MSSKEEIILINKITDNKFYDIEIFKNLSALPKLSMGKQDLMPDLCKRYKHVQLLNTDRLGTGQLHFITNDGHYMLLPWCYIISMAPSSQ